jgi:phage terminase large subunit
MYQADDTNIILSKIQMPEWAEFLFQPMRYKVAYGGRGGAKTWSFSDTLIILAAQKSINIVCAREFQNTIEDSVKTSLEQSIKRLNLNDKFIIQDTKIFGLNGSKFRFKGLARNIMSIKGWEDVDICWIEEANTLSQESLELLLPTIRKAGSEIWFSFNRHLTIDAVDKMFLGENKPANTIIKKVNYTDNPFFTAELEAERQRCLLTQPERYAHIWEGEPDIGDIAYRVLPRGVLEKCINAHKKLNIEVNGMRHAGLDVADEGVDTNAYAVRKSSLLEFIDEWKVKYLYQTATKADFKNKQYGVVKMYYDIGGMGAGIKSDLTRIPVDPQTGGHPELQKFIPFNFGGKVEGADRPYLKSGKSTILNKDFFSRLNAQAWWNLKLRADNTLKMLEGETIDPDRCLFISGDIHCLDKLLLQLSQCVYDDSTGKIVVDKKPEGAESPNLADAVVMAFASDLRKGLKV